MSSDPRIPAALDEFLARVRADLDAHFAALSLNVLEHVQQAEEAWRARVEALEARVEAERRELDGRLADERIEWQATLAAFKAETRDERIETFMRLVRAIRRLDEAASLSAILEALAKGVVAEASRVAVLIVESDAFRSWGHFGFAEGQGPFDVPVDQVAVLAEAVAKQQPSIISSADAASQADLPPFMHPPAGHAGLIAPLTVGGEVVAILYAEGAERRSEQEEAVVWAEEVELLVRHAAARLENVTSERTVAALTRTL